MARSRRGSGLAELFPVLGRREPARITVEGSVDRVATALAAIIGELERVKDELVSDVELRKVKEYIKGNTLLSLERSGYVAHWGGWQELMLGRIESLNVGASAAVLLYEVQRQRRFRRREGR